MRPFKLDETTSVGNFIMDEQHQHFILLVENLDDTNYDILRPVLNELQEYINYHFSAEEDLLEDVQYPLLEEHKAQHLEFVELVSQMVGKLEMQLLTMKEVKEGLMAWFFKHICVEDMKYKEYLKNY